MTLGERDGVVSKETAPFDLARFLEENKRSLVENRRFL